MSVLDSVSRSDHKLNSLNNNPREEIQTTGTVKDVATKKFAMMRVAAHDKKGNLKEDGQRRAFSAMVEIEALATKAGADTIRVVHSDTLSARQTVEYMRRCHPKTIDDTNVIAEARLNESKSGPLLKQLKKENPEAHKEYSQLPPEGQFEAKPVEGYESRREMYNRMNGAVQDHLNSADGKTFTVFISHQNSLLNWMRGLGDQVSHDWRHHHATTGEIYPLQQISGVFSQLQDRMRPTIEGVVV